MIPMRVGILALGMAFCTSCVFSQRDAPRPMETCVQGALPTDVDPAAFATALARAEVYSEKIYGKDCFVCAELMADRQTSYTLHITSPVEDLLLNTSATVTFRKSDGAVEATAQYHSCYARVKNWSR
jgi:hypothetical protein